MRKILKTPLTDLDLSVRALNSLEKNKVKSVEDLVGMAVDNTLDKDVIKEIEAIVAKERLRQVPHTETTMADKSKKNKEDLKVLTQDIRIEDQNMKNEG